MTHSSNRFLRLASFVAIAIAVAACSTTQTASRQVDDNEIHAAVLARLTAARFSNIVNIDVNVTNGVVTLAGQVPNAAVKKDAAMEARAVKGVTHLNNNLQIQSPPTS